MQISGMSRDEDFTRAKRPGALVLAAVSFALLATLGCGRGAGGPNPSGTLEATTVDVAPVIGGRVLEVRVEEGDQVKAGDTLVVLDTELISLERAEMEANRRTIEALRRVAAEEQRQAERNLELVETTLRRTASLLQRGSATQQQVDDLTAQRDVAASQVSAVKNSLDRLDADEGRIAAALATIDRRVEDGVITAPRPGTILVRALEPGEVASPGGVALRLADLSELTLRIYLEAEELDRVRLGQEVAVLVDALEGEELTGTATWVSSEAEFTPKNAQTRNSRAQLVYAVKVRVGNPDGRLHIGMPAEVRIP